MMETGRSMNRRDFLKLMSLGIAGLGCAPLAAAQTQGTHHQPHTGNMDNYIRDYLFKIKNFDRPDPNDVRIGQGEYMTFESVVMRLRRMEGFVGQGNFYLMSFDEGIRFAQAYSAIGPFSRDELEFMEKIFSAEAVTYGFFGEKTLKNITDTVDNREVQKIPGTGNYLFKGESIDTYENIKRQVGEQVILTSGIRGVMKQFLLFLNKAYASEGNLSLSSRSLAPPGYSYHGNGDFDVGQIELGPDNFTERFATTEVYHRLSDLGYLKLRYPENNMLGVRFEPWHIKVV